MAVVTPETMAEFAAAHAAKKAERAATAAKDPSKPAVVTPDPAAPATVTSAETGDVDLDDVSVPVEKKKSGLAKRFSELTGARDTAKEEARAAKEELAALKAQIQEQTDAQNKKAAAKPEPKPEEFKTAVEYANALADWKVEQKLVEKEISDRAAAVKKQQEDAIKEFNTRLVEASKRIQDFREITDANQGVQVTAEMRVAIIDSDLGPDVLYYLAKNPDQAASMRAMTVANMHRAFGKLEAKIEASNEALKNANTTQAQRDKEAADAKAAAALKAGRKPDPAPAPITPISGGVGAVQALDGKVDSEGNFTGSQAEFRALREAGKLGKRR